MICKSLDSTIYLHAFNENIGVGKQLHTFIEGSMKLLTENV